MKSFAILLLALLTFSFLQLPPASAHSGRTDSSGGHYCYVGACAGTYHYHNGGNSGGGETFGPRPNTPVNVQSQYLISNENWCNYDVSLNWTQPKYTYWYSISASKYPGVDPGPASDTSEEKYIIKNLTPGKWYINLKGGNANGWSNIVYFSIDLPTPTPSLDAFIIEKGGEKYLNYNISCINNIEGPDELITFIENNNFPPKGEIILTFNEPTILNLKATDLDGNELVKSLNYTPSSPQEKEPESNSGVWILLGLVGIFFINPILRTVKKIFG